MRCASTATERRRHFANTISWSGRSARACRIGWLDMARKFPLALDLGARTGGYGPVPGGPGGIEHVVSCELSERMARQIENSGVVCDPGDPSIR